MFELCLTDENSCNMTNSKLQIVDQNYMTYINTLPNTLITQDQSDVRIIIIEMKISMENENFRMKNIKTVDSNYYL